MSFSQRRCVWAVAKLHIDIDSVDVTSVYLLHAGGLPVNVSGRSRSVSRRRELPDATPQRLVEKIVMKVRNSAIAAGGFRGNLVSYAVLSSYWAGIHAERLFSDTANSHFRPLCAGRNYAQLPRDSQHRPLLRPMLLRIVMTSAGTS